MNKEQYEEYLLLKEKDRLRREKASVAVNRYLTENPKKRLLNTAKLNATTRQLDFSLTENDIQLPTHCPYLGVELTNILGKGRQPYNYSVDRIDSRLGYIAGNVQIISDLANRMKQEATPEQLIMFAKGVLALHGT